MQSAPMLSSVSAAVVLSLMYQAISRPRTMSLHTGQRVLMLMRLDGKPLMMAGTALSWECFMCFDPTDTTYSNLTQYASGTGIIVDAPSSVVAVMNK